MAEMFHGYGLTAEQAAPVVEAIKSDTKRWVDFMMRFELGLEEPNPDRARKSASLIAASYIVGGLIPLFPYMVWHQVRTALWISTASRLSRFLFSVSSKGGSPVYRPCAQAFKPR